LARRLTVELHLSLLDHVATFVRVEEPREREGDREANRPPQHHLVRCFIVGEGPEEEDDSANELRESVVPKLADADVELLYHRWHAFVHLVLLRVVHCLLYQVLHQHAGGAGDHKHEEIRAEHVPVVDEES